MQPSKIVRLTAEVVKNKKGGAKVRTAIKAGKWKF
jgi:hypothetical protein